MSTVASPDSIRFRLSGGATNSNVNLSTGGPASNFYIPFYSRGFNNLWSNVTERQIRYGYKDIRVLYLHNATTNLTFKNARVYWNQTDNHTTMQIGRAPVNATENTSVSMAAIAASGDPIPPSMWGAVVAADSFRVIQDFNNTNRFVGTTWGGSEPNQHAERVGVGIGDSSTTLFGQKIARITFLLKLGGTPRGPVNCKLWNLQGEELADFGSIDSEDVPERNPEDPEAAPFGQFAFTNINNDHPMEVGDVIGLEYPGAGQDESDGDPEDLLIIGTWSWHDADEFSDPSNVQYNVQGTGFVLWQEERGSWALNFSQDQHEAIFKAEAFGPEGPGGGGSCEPDPGGGGNNPPQEPRGFLVIQDFNDTNAQTAYTVGAGGPNNAFRRAVKIDNTTATILSAPIARITFLMRRIGNPTGTAFCRIWNNAGVVMQTIGSVALTGITNQGAQWTQVPFTMEENNYQMKVGDLIGVEFTTGTPQDHIAMAGWSFQSAAAAVADFEGAGIAAASDKFGVKMIYANSGNFNYDWEIPSNSDSMRWDLTNPPINMEMTGYFMKSSPSSDTVSCKIRGGRHTDSASSDGCCYIPQFPCTGGSMQFEIECPHPNNHDCAISGTHGTALSLAEWHGYKVAVWNTTNNCVHIEAFQDKGNNSGGTPTNQWEKVFVHDDCSGDCGNISNPLTRPKGSSSQCTFRIDSNSGTAGKWLSVVEIQPGGAQNPGGPPGGGGNTGAQDVPGTSIARWNGSVWAADDGGNSDLVYKAERFAVIGDEGPREDPIIIDPGTKRKPTSFDQGIVIPPLGPGDYKSLILERMFPPDPDKTGVEDVLQQIVVEIDATTEMSQPTDPNQPPPTTTPPPSQQLPGEFPVPQGFTRVGNFITSFNFWDRFETSYASGGSGPSLRWDCTAMTKLNMLAGYEFKIGPRHGTRGSDAIDIKFPRCDEPGGERGVYLAALNWDENDGPSDGGVGSEWPHPDTGHQDYNLDDPNPNIGNIKDGNWHGFLAACYNDSAGNVIIKQWYNASASGRASDYIYVGSAKDTNGNIPPAPKLAFASEGHSGGTHPMQIRIDEIPSNDTAGGPDKYPSANFELRNMFTCEIREGATTAAFTVPDCPPGQHYDPLQKVCVIDAGSAGTTVNGIILPSLPTPNYKLDTIHYEIQSDHKANGSFRETFMRNGKDLNSVIVGGYFLVDGPDDEEITAKLGGGVQTPSNAGIAGRCYNIDLSLDGNLVTVSKESSHGNYHPTTIRNQINIGPRQGHYTGVIFMKANIIWLGEPAVRLMAWVDTQGMSDNGTFTSARQNWVQILDEVDTGYWYDKPWLTGTVPGDSVATIRVDQQDESSYERKFCFVARIKGGPAY